MWDVKEIKGRIYKNSRKFSIVNVNTKMIKKLKIKMYKNRNQV